MVGKLLVCGLVAGLLAGVLAAGTATLVGEPSVDRAIAFEEAHARAAGSPLHDAEPAPVSRGVQKSAGLLTALLIYGAALGGLFSLVFAFAYGRLGGAGPQATAHWLAAGAFVAVYLVPFLKYPANPPSVGDPDTIARRTALYALMLAASLVSALAAGRLRRDLVERLGGRASAIVAAGAYVALAFAAGLALPRVDEVPVDFPATTLWSFRQASVALQLTLWAAIGLLFGYLAPRVMSGQPLVGGWRAGARGAPS